jgi:hypothetical protein
MDVTLDVLRVLEEYGRWKAEALTTYELDSKEAAKLSGEVADRLKGMEVQDADHTRDTGQAPYRGEYIPHKLIRQDICGRLRWRGVILKAADGETLKEKKYYLKTTEMKGGY